QTDGAAILGHVLGGAQPRAAQGLGQATGLGSSQAMKLLAVLAPIVLSSLATRSRAQGLHAGGLGQLLGQERAQVRQQARGGPRGWRRSSPRAWPTAAARRAWRPAAWAGCSARSAPRYASSPGAARWSPCSTAMATATSTPATC